ncbi:MAG: putative hydrolase of the HAD superfamily [Bermanella sp.]|jgi:putative hydrolase of the HAD superfamily
MTQFDSSAIKVLSFDLDDTLWDGMQVIIKAESAMHQWMMKNTPEVFEQFTKQALKDYKIAFFKNNPQLKNKLTVARKEYLAALFSHINYSDYQSKATICFDVFYQARQKVELFDGVTEALTKLKQDYRLVAITNGNADINLTGLGSYFEFCLNAEDFVRPKPHPEIFQCALSQLKIQPEHCLHIGDHPNHDMLGAYELGVKTCWLKDGTRQWDQSFKSDIEVSHVSELIPLLCR